MKKLTYYALFLGPTECVLRHKPRLHNIPVGWQWDSSIKYPSQLNIGLGLVGITLTPGRGDFLERVGYVVSSVLVQPVTSPHLLQLQ